jgi:hypothetical protein
VNKYHAYANAEKLPPIPSTIKPLPHDDESRVGAMVIAGLNLIGKQGYICPTVSIISANRESGEMFGWCLCLGNPEARPKDTPYYFTTSNEKGESTVRDTEIPNTIVYFQAEVDVTLAGQEANLEKLDEVFAYVLPYISDDGPPPADGKSFDELIAEVPTSTSEYTEALLLKEQISSFFECAEQELTGCWEDYALFNELNRRLHESGFNHAWKANPSDPDYNPDLGVVEKTIAGRMVTASIGLRKDRFTKPCAVIRIIDRV